MWSYATFIEVPGVGSDLYWSASRAYAPSIKEWLSPDPMVKWNPRLVATKPGNWASTRYANNSPLTYVDPSGGWVNITIGGAFGAVSAGIIASRAGMDGWHIAEAAAIGAAGGMLASTGIGGVAGAAAIGMATNIATQTMVEGKSVSKVPYGQVAMSAGFGVLGYGVGSAAGKYLTVPEITFGTVRSGTFGLQTVTGMETALQKSKFLETSIESTAGGVCGFVTDMTAASFSSSEHGFDRSSKVDSDTKSESTTSADKGDHEKG